jgi:phosphotriesterase-related protein
MPSDTRTGITRRDAIRLLGAGAGLTAVAANRREVDAAAESRTIVRTILEDVPPERLSGTTLFHEHLSTSRKDGTPAFDVGLIADEVKACAQDGVSCIVDTGNVSLGRKIDALRTIAIRSGVFIVACGGLHVKSTYPPDIFRKSADEISDDFVELARAERWGAIGEMGTGPAVPMDPDERKVLQAAAKTHLRTGLAIITHTSDGCAKCAVEQIDTFESAGAQLHRIVIGHLSEIQENLTAATIAIAKRGVYLGFDHSGRPDDPRADEYVRTILAVIDAGFTDRICLSSDFGNAKYLRKNGGPGIDMTVKVFVPKLRAAGVTDRAIHTILVENPRRLLSFQPKSA